jgi:hypothetical protein
VWQTFAGTLTQPLHALGFTLKCNEKRKNVKNTAASAMLKSIIEAVSGGRFCNQDLKRLTCAKAWSSRDPCTDGSL